MTKVILSGLALFCLQPLLAQQAASYLPLSVGNKWVLRGSHQRKPVIFEVLTREPGGFLLQSVTPWGSSRWILSDDGGRFFMVAYGNGLSGPMMPMPNGPVYLDFTSAPGRKWSNDLGTMTISSADATVHSQNRTYSDCVQIEHKAKNARLWSTFARGVGYVQFGQGNNAFVLDEAASRLPGSGDTVRNPSPEPRDERPSLASPIAGDSRVRFGVTINRFANEPMTERVMLNHLQETVKAGVTYISGTAKWADLEPTAGHYSLGSLSTFVSAAKSVNLPVSYTLRMIDTVRRDVPPDLQNTDWGEPRMRARAFALLDAVAPLLKDRVRWLSLGYEVDSYFAKHPDEIDGFTRFHAALKTRLRELLPGAAVSCTLTFTGITSPAEQLSALISQLDFVSLTYCPLRPDFTVNEPSVVPADFASMKRFANGRRIVLQEIGYPTSKATGGSEEKQAEFYRLSFAEIRREPQLFAAVNFMNLADLDTASVRHFSDFYGLHTPAFEGVLQTMGLFNERGEPKQAWAVLQSALKQ